MKKIFTTTFQNADNYGAMLQCYALNYFLNEKYYSEVINYDNNNISKHYKIIRSVDKNIIKMFYHIIIDLINYRDSKKRINNFEKFRKQIKFTNKIKNFDDLKFSNSDFFITGSDQVWNPYITDGLDDIYFLRLNSRNKISYAASCGDINTIIPYKKQFFENLSKFKNISVREKSLKDYLEKNTDKRIDVVLDPTLLLNQNSWKKIISKERLINEKYIFVYSVGNANQLFKKSVQLLSRLTGLKIVFFDKFDLKNNYKVENERWYKAGPSEFLNLLYYSEYVITTSFHGVALSTIFNKNLFIVLSTYPDRIITLINSIGLNNRIIKEENDVNRLLNNNIEWKSVNEQLKQEIKKSQEWLLNSINNKK